MAFTDLKIDIRYRSNHHQIARDFYIPVLGCCKMYKRATGYFSTSALVALSHGLAEMAKNCGHIRIICSPSLSKEDIKAINLGYKTREEIINRVLSESLTDPVSEFEEERLNMIANLIAKGMLDFRIAFMENDTGLNVYHEKIALFEDFDGNKIGYAGSMNESENGIDENFESFYTFCSWKDPEGRIPTIEHDFDEMWENRTDKIQVIPFPKLIIEKLMTYHKHETDYSIDRREFRIDDYIKPKPKFSLPDFVHLREYQKDAINKWEVQGWKGIYNMATGAGKTFTALGAMVRLAEKKDDYLAVFIICPYIHLVSQWEEDVVDWGFTPIIAHSKSPDRNWEQTLRKAFQRFRKENRPFICITTLDTFKDEKIQQYITRFTPDQNVLLIADEAHNLGAAQISALLPYNISNRIALSATIKRHMDAEGTQAIYDYFGDECINYDLERAIDEGTLVHYDYHPVIVTLQTDELNSYIADTNKMKKCLISENGKLKLSSIGQQLAFKRMRTLAGARDKIPVTLDLVSKHADETGILVYCGAAVTENEETAEEGRQIDLMTDALRQKFHMSVQRFTAEESLEERQNIKMYYITGQYQAITAIKCLDEGVNIPGIRTAFIMSSSRNPKEFIQRRGRLLRKCEGKTKSVIYDLITLPRDLTSIHDGDFESDKTIIIGELARIKEFGRLADNKYEAEKMMSDIMLAYGVYFDIDEAVKEAEENYE
ncbi:MAG: DEAD/DEAH box helicase family protein [Lachnospiraceae bacterium]|nr:DEAD/DEAH box helicase family protein [Lachnospiraceae bacterium]